MEYRNKKKRSIALLSVLAGIAYLYLISIDFINHWDSFANSFMEGYHASSEGRDGQMPFESFSLLLNAENIQNYYADSLLNLKNNRYLPAKMQIVDVKYISDITLYCYKKLLIEIAHYRISIHLSGAEWLFLGLITLLIANILKRSVELKEEQDLTI